MIRGTYVEVTSPVRPSESRIRRRRHGTELSRRGPGGAYRAPIEAKARTPRVVMTGLEMSDMHCSAGSQPVQRRSRTRLTL